MSEIEDVNCFRCGTSLEKSKLKDYTYYCPQCDEDFYRFEQENKELLECQK